MNWRERRKREDAAEAAVASVRSSDLQRMTDIAADLADAEAMEAAWRCNTRPDRAAGPPS